MLALGFIVYGIDLWLHCLRCPNYTFGVLFVNLIRHVELLQLPSFLLEQDYYPPLYYGFLVLAKVVLGPDYWLILIAQSLFTLAGAFYMTLLSRKAGLGALSFLPGVIMLLNPGIVLLKHEMMIEAPLLLIVPAFAYHLVASAGFQRRGHALWAGLWAGLGMLTKWSFPAYGIGPVLLVLLLYSSDPSRRRPRPPSASQWINLGLCALVTLIVSGWWYAFVMDWEKWTVTAGDDPTMLVPSFAGSFVHYLRNTLAIIAGPYWPGLLVLTGIGLILCRRRLLALASAVVLILPPLAIFSIPTHIDPKYLFPVIPAFAFALALLADIDRNRWLRVLVPAALTGICLQACFVPFTMGFHGIPMHMSERDRSEAPLVVDYLGAMLKDAPKGIELAIHPLFQNQHIIFDFLRYHMARDSRWMPSQLRGYDFLEYGVFHHGLLEGAYDVLLMDCGAHGECLAESEQTMLKDRVDLLSDVGFTNMITGEVMPDITYQDVVDDLERIHRDFEEVAVIPFDDDTDTRVYFSRHLMDAMAVNPTIASPVQNRDARQDHPRPADR